MMDVPTFAQSYMDGPIQLQVRVREIKTLFTASDAFIGLTDPDEMTYYVWAIDDAPISALPWQGTGCKTANFNPSVAGVNSPDFNTLMFNYTYSGPAVPQYVDIYLDAWEDDSDDVTCTGNRCEFDATVSCALGAFTTSDDYHCFTSGQPFKNNLNYRNGNPCQTYSHGYVVMDAGACSNNVYQPRIETFWRYTKGTACSGSAAINLNAFSAGSSILHFNSNECYGNTYAPTGGNDVFYTFNTTAPIGATISLCGAANFDTYLTLLDANCQPLTTNDNGCGQTSEIDYPLCTVGTYYVVVSGATAGAMGTFTLTITENPSILMSVSSTKTNVTCYGGTDGSATLTVTGGQPPYTIAWGPGSLGSGLTVTGLGAGSYAATVTDFFGCQIIEPVTITQPAQIQATVLSQTDPTCAGLLDGSIEMTTTGGSTPYQYSINLGNTFQNNPIFTNLGAGSFTVIAKDANGCADTVSNITLVNPPTNIVANQTVTNISCFGLTDGSVSFAPTGGIPPYRYSLNGGSFVTTSTFSGLAAGPINVTIKDNLGCELKVSYSISQPTQLTSLVTSTTDVSCNGSNDGSFTVTANGGTGAYQYSSNNGVTFQASNTFTALASGTYFIVVEDANGCQTANVVTIRQPTQLVAAELFRLDVTCNGSADGVAVIAVSGGNSPYQYSDDNIVFQTNAAFTNLAGGTYTFYVKDNSSCSDSVTITIAEPAVVAATATVTDATCNGLGDGVIVTNATGGTAPYVYSLNSGVFQSDSTFSGLAAGAYVVTVRDINFCENNFQFNVANTSTLILAISQTDVGCFGASTGAFTATASGGVASYTYSRDGGPFVASGTFTGLAAGTYTVTARDANTCEVTSTVVITERPQLVVTPTVNNATCFNVSDGTISLAVTGGTAPYVYAWSNSLPATANQINLAGGTYTVTVTDDSLCSVSLSIVVDQSPQIYLSIADVTNVSCNGASDGGIDLSVLGGQPPFVFAWSNAGASATEDLTNVPGGTYTVTVTDANGCETYAFATVSEETALLVTVSTAVNVTCSGGADGGLTVSAIGGVAPYSFALNGGAGQSDSVFSNLLPGTYFVVVTDAAGCSATTATAEVLEKDAIVLTYEDIEITQGESGQLVPVLTPVTLNIATISWNPTTGLSCTDCLDPIANPDQTTEYTVTITDVDGCTAQATVTVTVNQDFRVLTPNIFTPNGDGQNDQFQFYSFGAVKTEVSIFNRWGAQVYFNPNQQSAAPGWDGTFKGDDAPEATYVFMINVLFANGENRQVTGSVTLIR